MALYKLPKDRNVWISLSGIPYKPPSVKYEKIKEGYKMTIKIFEPLVKEVLTLEGVLDMDKYDCDGCGESYCKDSLNKINGQYVCDSCAREEEQYQRMNRFDMQVDS